MDKYEITLWWSDEDEVFVAEAPDLPGCMAHGETREAALASIQEAMRLWIEVARKAGDPIPNPKGRRTLHA